MNISTIIILFAIALIGFNVWNGLNLKSLLNKPLRSDQINDQKYWELKYKMQYMITVFSVILFVVGYLGYNSIQDAKQDLRKELKTSVDSISISIDSLKGKLSDYKHIVDSQFLRTTAIKEIIEKLESKNLGISRFISATANSAKDLSARVDELINNDQIKQHIYVIDNVPYNMKENTPSGSAEYKTYFFKNFKTVNGNQLPTFNSRPYIIGLSNESIDLKVANITSQSFDLMVYSFPGDRDISKDFLVTIVVIENK